MNDEPMKVSVEDSIACVFLRGRSDLNLMTREAILEFIEILQRVANDPEIKVLVIRGDGDRAFSAGVDVKRMKEFSPPEAEEFIRCLHDAMSRIMKLPQPVIASIHGPCLGGPMELIMACDLRVASDDAFFGLPEIQVGIPSVIEASLLLQVVGLGKARELILTGDTVDAREALRLGLVNKVVPRDRLEEETLSTARSFLRLSPKILSVQKDIIDKWLNLGHDQGAEYSAKAFALCFATPDPREGMEAFLEKREPIY